MGWSKELTFDALRSALEVETVIGHQPRGLFEARRDRAARALAWMGRHLRGRRWLWETDFAGAPPVVRETVSELAWYVAVNHPTQARPHGGDSGGVPVQRADGWYVVIDTRGRVKLLRPGSRMPEAVWDIAGPYATEAMAHQSALLAERREPAGAHRGS